MVRRHEFILVKPPWLEEDEALRWASKSLDFAFDHRSQVCSLIPLRGGNGALEALAKQGDFAPPKLLTLERALDYGIGLKRGRAFADIWDLSRFSDCEQCFPARATRLAIANQTQLMPPSIGCDRCGEPS